MKDNEKKPSLWLYAKKIWPYMKDSKKDFAIYVIISFLLAVSSAFTPLLSSQVILNITSGTMDALITAAVILAVLLFAHASIMYYSNIISDRIFERVMVNLQMVIAKKTLKLEVSEIDQNSTGLFIERINSDTRTLADLFTTYANYIPNLLSRIGIFVAIFILNKYLFLYIILGMIILILINIQGMKKKYEVRKEWRVLDEKKVGLTSELIRGIRDIKVLNANDTILNKTKNSIDETTGKELKMSRIGQKYYYITDIGYVAYELIFILIGILLYGNNLLTLSTFLIIYYYLSRVEGVATYYVEIVEYNKAFVQTSERIFEIIDDKKFKKEKFGDKHVTKLNGNIEFKNVSFGYDPNKLVIDNMSFKIKENQKVSFVGKSGAGKTTLLSLITKLYNPNSGQILLDGYNINDLDCSSIRNNMSLITQDPYIFNFSVKDNLLLTKPDATMNEIREVCKLACIDDYIMSLPDKYETMLGENGVILSGGQKQRIAIARALLMKTEIILFDEATSSLDNITQSEIQNAIDNLKGEYTIIIVAHRLSTVIDSDKIFVVNDGKIVDAGTHKELLANCPFYDDLYEQEGEK